MARFVSSRHGSEALEPVQVQIGAKPVAAPVADVPVPDTSCFDSSWDLRQGLDVAELEALPDELLAPPVSGAKPRPRP